MLGVGAGVCRNEMVTSSNLKQKLSLGNSRCSLLILYNLNSNGECVIACTYINGSLQAKYLMKRSTASIGLYIKEQELGVNFPETWSSFSIYSSLANIDKKATVISSWDGFTPVTIQETPALDYGSLGDLASALGVVQSLGNDNDLDPTTVNVNCVFRFSENSKGYFPSSIGSWGYCIVLISDNSFRCVIAMSYSGMYVRTYWGSWYPWRTIELT